MTGERSGDLAGRAVAGIGDQNGDDVPDLLLGAPQADPNARDSSGSAYVVFGRSEGEDERLSEMDATSGFRIDGANAGDRLGSAVAAAGDANGDGTEDVLLGAPAAPPANGSAYVVFGGAYDQPVDVAALAERGYELRGAHAGEGAGTSVAGIGDVNADGHGDQAIGAPGSSLSPQTGRVYVSFGKASSEPVALGSNGLSYALHLMPPGLGWSVSGAGDVNRDGRPDVMMGAPFATAGGKTNAGKVFFEF